MAVVRFKFTSPVSGDYTPVVGDMWFEPTARRVIVGDPDNIVLPIPFSLSLANGAADVDLAQTGPDWVWKVTERIHGRPATSYHVAVPSGAGPIDAPELVKVNPGDYTPIDTTKNVSLADLDSRVTDLEAGGGGGGAVASVNSKTGAVVLSASDVGAAPSSVTGRVDALEAANTVTFTTLTSAGQSVTIPAGTLVGIALKQDATGGRTASWPTGVIWAGGSAPVLSTAAYAVDMFTFVRNGSEVYGMKSSSYAPAPPPDTSAPTAPTGLTASNILTTSVDLSWTAATDNVGVTGYRVSKDNAATWITSSVTGTSYTVTGLTANTSYTFAVQARDAAGNWGPSATITRTTAAAADSTPPSALTGLTAGTPTSTTIPLSWTAATDNVAVTGYEFSKDAGATWTSTGSTGTTYTVTGLTASTAYTIQVRAFDAAGNKGTAGSVSATTAAAAGLTTLLSDTFTAANGTIAAVHPTTDTGQTWDGSTAGSNIDSNRLSPSSTVLHAPISAAAQEVTFDVVFTAAGVLQVSPWHDGSTSPAYGPRALIDQSGQVGLNGITVTYNASGGTVNDYTPAGYLTFAADSTTAYPVRILSDGSGLSLYINGTLIIQGTPKGGTAGSITNARIGIARGSGTGGRLDNLVVKG